MRVTVEEIARLANVSKATVSRVLNGASKGVSEKTRKQILELVERLDYHPNLLARGIASGKSLTIGMLVPDITSAFFPSVIQSAAQCAQKYGYTLLVAEAGLSKEREKEAITTMIAKRVDGLILTSLFEDWQEIHDRLRKFQIPCVLLDRKMKGMPDEAGVFVDNEFAFFLATEHFIRAGHKHIALISGPRYASTVRERVEGYKSALAAYQLPYESALVQDGEFSIQWGYDCMCSLILQKSGCSCVLAANDSIAVGILRALKALRILVPQEMEVIGFDHSPMTDTLEPALSLVEQPVWELGEEAVKLLHTLIDRLDPEERMLRLESRLLLRGTTRN